jgi:LysR family glycine cleavage system transcriptional activator
VQLFPQLDVERSGYWLVYPEYKRQQPKIIAFRDWILSEVERMRDHEPAEIFEPLRPRGCD